MRCGIPMRMVTHPGAKHHARSLAVGVQIAASIKLTVPPGSDLFETVHAELDALGASGGSFRILSGAVTDLRIMTGGPGEAETPIGFHGPHELSIALSVVDGAANSGVDEAGVRFTHCHAVFVDDNGRLIGGHLTFGGTIAGDEGITVKLYALSGARFQRRLDPETQFNIFHPEPA